MTGIIGFIDLIPLAGEERGDFKLSDGIMLFVVIADIPACERQRVHIRASVCACYCTVQYIHVSFFPFPFELAMKIHLLGLRIGSTPPQL